MASFNLEPKYWKENQYLLNPEKIKKIKYELQEDDNISHEQRNENDMRTYGIILADIVSISLKKLDKLTDIRIIGSNLLEIPDCLPQTLINLYLPNNLLKRLPKHLPSSLEKLCISNNQIKDLTPLVDNYLPKLRVLLAYKNSGLELPSKNLPNSINIMDISDCGLKNIPFKLPVSLIHLSCHSNNLKLLPPVLPIGLELLDCSNNQIEFLPPISPRLIIIKAGYNNLQFLDIDILDKICISQKNKLIIEVNNNPELPNYDSLNRYPEFSAIFDVMDIKNNEENHIKTFLAKSKYRLKSIRNELLAKYHDICFSPSRVARLLTSGEMDMQHLTDW